MPNGGLSDYLEGRFLDYLTGVDIDPPAALYVALTSDVPTDSTWTEITVNGCTRELITLTKSGETVSNNADITFGPASGGAWPEAKGWVILDANAAGNRQIHGEMISDPKVCTVDPATDTFTSTAHGKSNNDRVMIKNENGNMPGGVTATTVYYVIGATANTFQISATEGGAAVNVTSAGDGTHKVYTCWYQTVQNGNELKIPSGQLQFSMT